MRQTGKNVESWVLATAKLIAGEKVAFIGTDDITQEKRLLYFKEVLGDSIVCEPIMSAGLGLAPRFIYDEEGVVAMLPKLPKKLIGYSFKLK